MIKSATPTWIATREEDGAEWFRIGRAGNRLVAEWPGVCVLEATRDGSASEIFVEPNANPLDVEKIRRGAAYALVARLQGKLAFHASAVDLNGEAILMFGRNGAGKSTLAATLTSRSAALLADDIAVVCEHDGMFEVVPTERHHWLLPEAARALGHQDGANEKQAFAPGAIGRASRLVACCSLSWGGAAPQARPIVGLAVMEELVSSLVRFVLDEPSVQQLEMEELLTFAARVPFYSVIRPRDLRVLHEAAKLIEDLTLPPEEPQ